MTEWAVIKIAPFGSTQRNECLNHVIASKNLKIRFYGSSESCGLITVSQKLEHKTCTDELKRYVKKYNLKREQQRERQKTMKHKIARKKNRAKRKQQR